MPNYLKHTLFNFFLLIPIIILYQRNPFLSTYYLFIFLLSYFIGTVFLTPDMDIKSKPSRACGIYCTPYRLIFKHRGLSHNWLLGILTRIFYVLFLISIPIIIIYGKSGIETLITALIFYKIEFLISSIGLFISNIFHIFLDSIT